ncbi:hypothetical protein Tco_0989647, partial [Tanacetum coccineum]
MDSKSSATKHVTPAPNVAFECNKGILAFNNGIAFLEPKTPLYQPMLKILSNCYATTNTITFTLSCFEKPLSFNLGDFSTITGLKYSENNEALPPKETVRAGLETMGLLATQPKALTDKKSKKKKNLSSSKPNTSTYVRRFKQMKTVVETQHAEEPVATAETTQSLEASESADKVANWLETTAAKKIITPGVDPENSRLCKDLQHHAHEIDENLEDPLATDSGIQSLGNVNLDQVMEKQANNDAEITFMRVVPFDQVMKEANSNMESMPDDDIFSISRYDDEEFGYSEKKLFVADEIVAENFNDELLSKANIEDTHIIVF